MKALCKRHKVDYTVYQGDDTELERFLLGLGFNLWGENIYRESVKVAEVRERDKSFFNHFVVEDGRLFKMTEDQFLVDYFPVND